MKFGTKSYKNAGFKVVATNNQMPVPPISDYTPYAQAMLTADNGKAPDADRVRCSSTDCIPMWNLIKAQGFQGTYSQLAVLGPPGRRRCRARGLQHAVRHRPTEHPGHGPDEDGLRRVPVGRGAKADTGMVAGYTSTDMFIQALKKVAAKGKTNITPANVQKVGADQTWQMKGSPGPRRTRPDRRARARPAVDLVLSDGTKWNQVLPFTCGSQKIKP